MSKLLGVPEWLALTLWVALILTAALTWGWRSIRKAHRQLAERRPSPSRSEFIELMGKRVEPDISEWMWSLLLPYYQPITPHPDDHLIEDARIDDDDITMDWLPRFAKDQGLIWQDWPDWPSGAALTVRNFAHWLQDGRRHQVRK